MSDPIFLAKTDYLKLMAMIENSDLPAAEALEEELGRAEILADDQLPAHVVRMGSLVSFEDLDTGERTSVTLVFPQEANADLQCISVLSPMGSALIGLAEGGTIEWPLPNGRMRRVKVVAAKPPVNA
jgi:regulator of nucleoside diphosphate kinase